eukprot:NODE_1328_length_2009_cov_36.901379_g1123_i0.p1 GENE.NODE_1328_length_2009_cov_36.901379_g1123_i0~~NODE_1328_length_2009_cov_36.901379_g1123_i0.p1  ORF type:complete len:630 (+),score=80.14 NODE_1328_length_2009_cov_36.901379_g1123_i0:252-1892(+)
MKAISDYVNGKRFILYISSGDLNPDMKPIVNWWLNNTGAVAVVNKFNCINKILMKGLENEVFAIIDALVMMELDYFIGSAHSSLSYVVWQFRNYKEKTGIMIDPPGFSIFNPILVPDLSNWRSERRMSPLRNLASAAEGLSELQIVSRTNGADIRWYVYKQYMKRMNIANPRVLIITDECRKQDWEFISSWSRLVLLTTKPCELYNNTNDIKTKPIKSIIIKNLNAEVEIRAITRLLLPVDMVFELSRDIHPETQQNLIYHTFPFISHSGCYALNDLHTSYIWYNFQFTTTETLKSILQYMNGDEINYYDTSMFSQIKDIQHIDCYRGTCLVCKYNLDDYRFDYDVQKRIRVIDGSKYPTNSQDSFTTIFQNYYPSKFQIGVVAAYESYIEPMRYKPTQVLLLETCVETVDTCKTAKLLLKYSPNFQIHIHTICHSKLNCPSNSIHIHPKKHDFASQFDFIIDDSGDSGKIIDNLHYYFNFLNEGGTYIIEKESATREVLGPLLKIYDWLQGDPRINEKTDPKLIQLISKVDHIDFYPNYYFPTLV